MKILFLGDVVGRAGRDAIKKHLPALRAEHTPDAIIINVDNAAGGFGVTAAVCKDLLALGADALTGGDHVWDQKDTPQLLETEPRLLRPHNFPPVCPGAGLRELTTASGKKLVLLHLLGQVFHKEYLDSPFTCADAALAPYKLGKNCDAILVDMHAEATSEKQAMGHFLDGRVSAVVGSHTHVPTADARILPKGTAFQTDTGMCGDYTGTIIGFQPEGPMEQFLKKRRKIKMEPGTGAGTLAAALIETDPKTGLAVRVDALMRG